MTVRHIHFFESEITLVQAGDSVIMQCGCGATKTFGPNGLGEPEEAPAPPAPLIQ